MSTLDREKLGVSREMLDFVGLGSVETATRLYRTDSPDELLKEWLVLPFDKDIVQLVSFALNISDEQPEKLALTLDVVTTADKKLLSKLCEKVGKDARMAEHLTLMMDKIDAVVKDLDDHDSLYLTLAKAVLGSGHENRLSSVYLRYPGMPLYEVYLKALNLGNRPACRNIVAWMKQKNMMATFDMFDSAFMSNGKEIMLEFLKAWGEQWTNDEIADRMRSLCKKFPRVDLRQAIPAVEGYLRTRKADTDEVLTPA